MRALRLAFLTLFLLLAALALCAVGLWFSSPLRDLASPSQRIRDEAAAKLRENYQEVPKSAWRPLLGTLRKGQTRAEVEETLRPFRPEPAGGAGGMEYYRLDNTWVLDLRFHFKPSNRLDDTLFDWDLRKLTRSVAATVPENFSGKWVTYYVSGMKYEEITYKDGRYFGEFVAYNPDGSRSYARHYKESGVDGDEKGYFPSGKVRYTGRFENNKAVGQWLWFEERDMMKGSESHAKSL